jgi:hypothetical protein
MIAINMLHDFTVLHDDHESMTTLNPEWQTREMTFMLVTFIHKECLEIANMNDYMLIESENHPAGGMQHIILCHRLSICNNIDSWSIRQCQTVNNTCNYMEHFTACCENQVNKKVALCMHMHFTNSSQS